MIYSVLFDNQIKVWWDYNKLYDGDFYLIKKNENIRNTRYK